jgi:hypothetical protein
VRGFSLAESENLSSLRRNSGGTERHARTLGYMKGKRERMSVWTGTNPSPGPRRLMKTPSQSTLSPKGARGSGVKRAPAKKAGIVTEILC